MHFARDITRENHRKSADESISASLATNSAAPLLSPKETLATFHHRRKSGRYHPTARYSDVAHEQVLFLAASSMTSTLPRRT